MDNQLQKYYENMFSMFCSDGWKDLIEDLGKMIAVRNDIDGLNTVEELHFAKGELSIMKWIENLEESYHNTYEQLKEEGKNANL